MTPTRRALIAALAGSAFLGASGGVQAGPRILGIDHTGRVVDETMLGGWRLVYFGYTHCPDVCPLGLQTMAEAVDALGARGAQITPVFVTIDPERDTPAVMHDYVDFFHPRLVGVTPGVDDLRAMAAAWRIKYARVELGEGRPYLMDHTASILLIDRDGTVVVRFSHTLPSDQMAAKIRAALDARS